MRFFFEIFSFFKKYVGLKIHLLFVATFFSSFLEGIGMTLLLPLLNPGGKEAIHIPKGLEKIFSLFNFGLANFSFTQSLMLILGIFILKSLLVLVFSYFKAQIFASLGKELKISFAHKLKEIQYLPFSQINMGTLNNGFTMEVNRILGSFNKFSVVVVYMLDVVIYLFMAFLLDWKLVSLLVGAGLLFLPIVRKINASIRLLSRQQTENNNQIHHFLLHFLNYFKYFKATSQWKIVNKLDESIQKQADLAGKRDFISQGLAAVIEPYVVLVIIGYLYFMVVLEGKEISFILVTALFLYRTSTRVFSIPRTWNELLADSGAIKSFQNLEGLIHSHREPVGAHHESLPVFEKEIRFENVSFSYGDKKILDQLNLVIGKNQSVGIVGSSGAGKTTFFDLLVGLLNPTEGKILLDGKDYRIFSREDFRKLFSYVTQEIVLFNDTLENNITMWDDLSNDLNRKRFEKALDQAHATEFVSHLEKGYQTMLGEKGVYLSGGQRQRVAIARELYRNSEIFILDEATSALDGQSEKVIQEGLEQFWGKKTLLIISHRLSAVRNCDSIYVLENGKIKEQGSWKELIKNEESHFYKICRQQGVL